MNAAKYPFYQRAIAIAGQGLLQATHVIENTWVQDRFSIMEEATATEVASSVAVPDAGDQRVDPTQVELELLSHPNHHLDLRCSAVMSLATWHP